MKRPRLEMALNNLKGSDWQRFETFASEFLASEYENLRTVAAPSGDEGRDAELFSPTDDTTVVFQFSVTESWRSKILSTVKRITNTIPSASILIYVTNQRIGADADPLKKEIRKDSKIHLDVRDQFYFLERFSGNTVREAAAESLIEDIVEPLLVSSGVIQRHGTELNSEESKAAFIYLGLQWKDDTREKGLTKLAFEAVIRSVLINTNSDRRMARVKIKEIVKKILPHHDSKMVEAYSDSALKRLTKKAVRHWQKEDEFCLTYEETEKLKNHLADLEISDKNLLTEIATVVKSVLDSKKLKDLDVVEVSKRVRRILERFLYQRSESFATALQSNTLKHLSFDDLIDVINKDISNFPDKKKNNAKLPDVLILSVRLVLLSVTPQIQQYLRSLSDSYTLHAYLKQTPDIQSAVEKMFSHGEIWLDTNIVLPLFAEELLDEDEQRFQRMIKAAREVGIKLRVTSGVIEEIERHMNRCLTCVRSTGRWEGYFPYLLTEFLSTGKGQGQFPAWLENFRGNSRPEDDIADFLRERWSVEVTSLEDNVLPQSEMDFHAA